ncbi:MAG: TonB-dependent receptor, partial [Muribaculaceae bacterium]|nr:TonB-dependent receptor [Muribaculaceae bacterium]
LPYTAALSGSASLSAEWRGFSLTYAVTAMGERFAAYLSGPDNRIAPYADQSLSAACTLPLRRCRLSVRAEALNLAGKNYQVIRYYPMPGRQFRISTSITI